MQVHTEIEWVQTEGGRLRPALITLSPDQTVLMSSSIASSSPLWKNKSYLTLRRSELTWSHAPHMCFSRQGIKGPCDHQYFKAPKCKEKIDFNLAAMLIPADTKQVFLHCGREVDPLARVLGVTFLLCSWSRLLAPPGPCSPLRGMGTTEATLRMENMEVKDEWQDEDFPR